MNKYYGERNSMKKLKNIRIIIFITMLFSSYFYFAGQATSVTNSTAMQQKSSAKTDIISMLKQATHNEQSNILYALFLAFLAGVLVSFTPCVYPMIPITVGILQAQAQNSMTYNFFSALSYVFGMSFVYAILGYISATTSIIFGRWLSSPWFILFVVLFFLYLAFSMFGFYELYIPSFLTRQSNLSTRHSLFHSFLFGALSGTVASPCLTPALAVLLAIAAKTGSPLLGFLYLLFFAFGMGTLLLLLGTFSGALHMLPRSGEWMEEIKKAFGFIMLITCAYFLSPILDKDIILELSSMILFGASLYYFCSAKQNRLKIFIGLMLFLTSIALLAIAIKGGMTLSI